MIKYKKTCTLLLVIITAASIITLPSTGASDGLVWDAWVYILGWTTTSPILEEGRLYKIVASPDYPDIPKLDRYSSPMAVADAQYYSDDSSDTWSWTSVNPAPDGHSFLQINGEDQDWGPYNPDHSYEIFYEGEGTALIFQIKDWYDGDTTNNYCHLHVYIYDMGTGVHIEKYTRGESSEELWVCKLDKPKVLTMLYTGDDVLNHNQDPRKMNVEGDPGPLPNDVHIIAADKKLKDLHKAKIYFEGDVTLGGTFGINASAAGASKLKANTYVHIYDLAGGWLRTIKFHTSCSQPLVLGDKYGGIQLVGFIGEHGATADLPPP